MSEKQQPQRIVVPPFPELVWDRFFWTCRDVFPSWAGFQERKGSYDSLSSNKPSKGEAKVSVKPTAPEVPPSAEQAAAYRYLKDNEQAIAATVLEAIVDEYASLPDRYGLSEEEARKFFPPVVQRDDFRKLIGISYVHVLPVWNRGVAYIGFEFGCEWDHEHGLGVMAHENRIVAAGGADTSFLEWIAERDAKKQAAKPPKSNAKSRKPAPRARKAAFKAPKVKPKALKAKPTSRKS